MIKLMNVMFKKQRLSPPIGTVYTILRKCSDILGNYLRLVFFQRQHSIDKIKIKFTLFTLFLDTVDNDNRGQ